jgi:hypothetical protein
MVCPFFFVLRCGHRRTIAVDAASRASTYWQEEAGTSATIGLNRFIF